MPVVYEVTQIDDFKSTINLKGYPPLITISNDKVVPYMREICTSRKNDEVTFIYKEN